MLLFGAVRPQLGIAPAAAWIAIRGTLDWPILLLTAAVTCWTAGFDIIYACQDHQFDSASSLHSIPQALGIPRALLLSRLLHLIMVALLLWLAQRFGLGILSRTGIAVVASLLIYEHSLVKPDDLSRVNAAFFAVNGVVSILFGSSGFLVGTWCVHSDETDHHSGICPISVPMIGLG